MKQKLKNGIQYNYKYDDLIDQEKYLIGVAHTLYTNKKELNSEFLEKHCTFNADGQCNMDYRLYEDCVWQDFRDMHNLDDEIQEIKRDSYCLEVKDENDLSKVFYEGKALNELEKSDFSHLKMFFNLKSEYYGLEIDNADIEYAHIYTVQLGNGNFNAILFESDNYYGEIYEIDELFDYLNQNYPDRDGFNYLYHKLNTQTNEYKLLMMNHKDSDARLDSNYFLIDKEEYDEYQNGSRCLDDIMIYDDNFKNIRIGFDEKLNKTIISDYEKSQESKLTVEKLKTIVESHTVSDDKPKSKIKIRRKM
ncbi:hypothetical protein KW496_19480 [Vibrio fluvialis]|nr:hypothetical protein [Vibrio fluvialis]